MLSKYFEMKTKTKKFDDDLLWSMGEIKGKRVLLYGAGEGFVELNKKYYFKEVLNIVAIADKKFECECDDENECTCNKEFEGIRAISPQQILKEDYDVILITNEYAEPILNYIFYNLQIKDKDVRTVFNEDVVEERNNFNYLQKFNFDKNLEVLKKKLKKKSIVVYGAGIFFEIIKTYYNLKDLNIIGISDKKFENHAENEEFHGYKVYSPEEIKDLKPNYVLVATKMYMNVIEDLYYNILKNTKIKIKPFVKKPFLTLIKEIWG